MGICQAIGKQHAIEVIALVLHHAGVKALDGAINPPTPWVQASVMQLVPAADAPPQAGHAQTAPYVRKEVRLVRPIHQGANHDR